MSDRNDLHIMDKKLQIFKIFFKKVLTQSLINGILIKIEYIFIICFYKLNKQKRREERKSLINFEYKTLHKIKVLRNRGWEKLIPCKNVYKSLF